MGGSVTAVIRFSDGEILGKETWTNSFFHHMKNVNFIQENKKYIYDLLEYDPEEKNVFNATEYGIIVIDFLKKKIVSCQVYSNPSTASIVSAFISSDKTTEASYDDLIQSGYVKDILSYHDMEYTKFPNDIHTVRDFLIFKYKDYIPDIDSLETSEIFRISSYLAFTDKSIYDLSTNVLHIDYGMDFQHENSFEEHDLDQVQDYLKSEGIV